MEGGRPWGRGEILRYKENRYQKRIPECPSFMPINSSVGLVSLPAASAVKVCGICGVCARLNRLKYSNSLVFKFCRGSLDFVYD